MQEGETVDVQWVTLNKLDEITHAPFLKYIYRADWNEILKTNNLIQVLTGIAYHNDFQQSPITLDFKVGISLLDDEI